RFPRMISFREKKPEEATTESEIISMYKKQKHVQLDSEKETEEITEIEPETETESHDEQDSE
ncbi:MAG: hypothetical protein Q7K42_04360, partial [Candidatus Diapherotrites archaeon]|nr:hypothetical protein [Candidatus Diapherotrites archaeon]